MAPHCLVASKEAGCVSDFMANRFHNIKFYFALSGFSVQARAQVRVQGRSWGWGQEVPPPQAAEFRGRETNILNKKKILFLKKFLRQIKGNLKNNSTFVKDRNLRRGRPL
jgi:hypothetical protein